MFDTLLRLRKRGSTWGNKFKWNMQWKNKINNEKKKLHSEKQLSTHT